MSSSPSRRTRPPRRGRRTVGLLAAVLGVVGVTQPLPRAEGQPVGTSVTPIHFDLNDYNGAWFDSGLDLFGGRSLAVASLPTVGAEDAATQVSSVGGLLNLDLGSVPGQVESLVSPDGLLATVAPALSDPLADLGGQIDFDLIEEQIDGLLPTLPDADLDELLDDLGVDTLEEALTGIGTLLDDVEAQLDAATGDAIDLGALPVGAEYASLLGDLAELVGDGIRQPVPISFTVEAPAAETAHSVTSLIWPTGAANMPFDQSSAFVGTVETQLEDPGLYAFTCKIHPYMLGAVVVDDPVTPGLDFGRELSTSVRGGIDVPSNADIIFRLVQAFFKITVVDNWQDFSNTEEGYWDPNYPTAPILVWDDAGNPILLPSLDGFFQTYFDEGRVLPALTQRPSTPGIGEVWIDTQMEMTAGKDKPGTATMVDVSTWTVDRKVALPEINMNNPHNMWTNEDQSLIYQTEWFSDRLTVFERETGELVRTLEVGPAPSHVMTRTDTGQLHIALNAGNAVVEAAPGGTAIDRRIPTQLPGERPSHPHAHWMSADGSTMVTPNPGTFNSTVVDVPTGEIYHDETGDLPIASSMTPDSSKYYTADFLDATVTCNSLGAPACVAPDGSLVPSTTIDLWEHYDPVTGPTGDGPFGGLPIQLPVAPDGQSMLVANTLTSNILVIDPETDAVVSELPCDAGCHGINFGAQLGGGYYGYVSSKFADTLAIVDPDPNGDGDPSDAAIVGKMELEGTSGTAIDDTVVSEAGMGGMGVLAIPLAYNGWVQQVPNVGEFRLLTCQQRHPITYLEAC
jgi:DNA-binding beta-propeller fold protein YncE